MSGTSLGEFEDNEGNGWLGWHWNTITDTSWKEDIEEWLKDLQPTREGIESSMSGKHDFYLWVKEGKPANRNYSLRTQSSGEDRWTLSVQRMLQNLNVHLIGFNRDSPTQLWYVEIK